MSFLAQLRIRNHEGAIERVLGVTRVRGFRIQSMSAQPAACGQFLELMLRLASGRAAHRLSRPLARLHVVESVEIFGQLESVRQG